MNVHIERMEKAIEPLRRQIIEHRVYSAIKSIEDLKIFMQYHVFAVWDFMSLLKTLQNNLTCTSVPWFPKGLAETRYLINEIVAGEESDVNQEGNRMSHFELYLTAMQQCGAAAWQVEKFIAVLKSTGDRQLAFNDAAVPPSVRSFVDFTFHIINENKEHVQAAIFTFGREDLIPGMFMSIINDMNNSFPGSISIFKYYLDRHIEVDGDHHSKLALQMTANLCGNNSLYWQQAEQAAVQSLQKRIELWDGIYLQLSQKRASAGTMLV